MSFYPDRTDFSTFWQRDGTPDLDPNWRKISGQRAVLERVIRRWISKPGDYDETSFGYPVRIRLNASMLPIEMLAVAAGMRAQALHEEGVADCAITLTKSRDGTLIISAVITLADRSVWNTAFVLAQDKLPRITLLQAAA